AAPDRGSVQRGPCGHRRCPVRRCARHGSGRSATHDGRPALTAGASATRNSPIRPPTTVGRPAARAVLLRPSWLWPHTAFWVVWLTQQLPSPFQDGHLILQLADALVGRSQLGLFGTVQTG